VEPISGFFGKDMSRHYAKHRPRLENVDHAYGRWLLGRYQRRVALGAVLLGLSPISAVLAVHFGIEAYKIAHMEEESTDMVNVAAGFGYIADVGMTVGFAAIAVAMLSVGIVMVVKSGKKVTLLCEYLHRKILSERARLNLKIAPVALPKSGGLSLAGTF
jgi:hypothetical protein